MKNFDDIRPDLNNLPPPAPFPDAPGITDTASFRVLIPVLFTQLYALFTPKTAALGAASRLRELRAQLQKLYAAEKQNFCLWLKRAMKSDPAWQAQVREDLGGDKAMAAWEKRRIKLQSPAPQKPANPEPAQAKSHKTRKRADLKTDRYGRFCLAPLTRKKARKPQTVRGCVQRGRNAVPLFIEPGAIPLTPEGLRPAPLAVKSVQGHGNIAAPRPGELTEIWYGLLAETLKWNGQLIFADLALTIPALRQNLPPP